MPSDDKMADRIEREIEEILERLDVEPGATPSRKATSTTPPPEPLSFADHRKRKNSPSARLSRATEGISMPFSPATLMFSGAGIMIVGLILSMFVGPLIWLSFAGVILFIAAFVWSFFRRPGAAAPIGGPRETVWRGRRIQYDPTPNSTSSRIRRIFRR